ncbi:MAG: SEC-C domain-containing protein [Actinomycetota bacterium]|nr:SEC-C domain-containing protein [Actinomycetota bacterium]
MSKRITTKTRPPADGQINPRQACPCGSGKRYKACHGDPGGLQDAVVSRPFAGLAAECQLVALREFVPSATAPLQLAQPAERDVTLATVLPTAAAAIVRSNGAALIGLQVLTRSGDLSRDLGRAVSWALTAEPGSVLAAVNTTAEGEQVRLQELLHPDTPLDVTMYRDFAWWIPGDETPSGEAAASLEKANAAIMPTEAVTGAGLEAVYWVDAGEKAHIRWVRPEPEERLLAAMARLAARHELDFGDGSRFAGSFRAHGVLVPVWDVDREQHAREWVAPAEAFAARLAEAVESLDSPDAPPLTDAERRALRGLRGRQVTLR